MEPTFEFGKLQNGGILMLCSESLPQKIKHVEYYCEPKIFILTFHNNENGENDYMINYELNEKAAKIVEESTSDTILLVDAHNTSDVKGYSVPFLKLGQQ